MFLWMSIYLLLTQLMSSRAGRKLNHKEVFPIKASADAVQLGDVGAPGGRLLQDSHHLGIRVVGELNECR